MTDDDAAAPTGSPESMEVADTGSNGVGRTRARDAGRSPGRRRVRRILLALVLLPVGYYLLCIAGLVYLHFLPPVTTGVQLQRVVERSLAGEKPIRSATWMPLEQMSQHLPHAVVAAEDARFYRHNGFDLEEIRRAREEAERQDESMRGASTLTHQLLKNLFFTTHRNPVRKLYEWGLTLPAEWILGKDRILELYLNVVEFGPGRFGAEAAAQYHFGVSAAELSRYQSMGLAAILPAPLRRNPARMGGYVAIIDGRMDQMGW